MGGWGGEGSVGMGWRGYRAVWGWGGEGIGQWGGEGIG